MRFWIYLLAGALILAGCKRQGGAPRMAIVDGVAIDAKGRTDHSVLVVAGARFLAAGTTADPSLTAEAARVDARGKFVIPGFVKEPPDWPATPLTTYQKIDNAVNVEGAKLVYGIVEDRVVEEYRWFDSMRQKAVVFVPRISRLEPGSEAFKIAAQNLVKLAESDVAIAALAPNDRPDAIFEEFDRLSEAGLSAQQILNAATLNAALALRNDDYGLLLPEKRASFLVLSADPTESTSNLRKIERIMVNGVWRNDGLPVVN